LVPVPISRVAFGIRYEPHYGLLDTIGSVVDAVLRERGSPFNPDTFPHSSATPHEHALLNEETDNYLRINHSDTILSFAVDTRNLSRVRELAHDFNDYVVVPLRKIAHLRSIVRTGLIVTLTNAREVFKTTPITHYLAADFPNATTMTMKFSRRLPSEEAMVKKRVNDFRNVIYFVNESEKGDVTVTIDYQEYYSPPLDAGEWDDRPFPKFVDRGLNYFEGEFQRWLQRLGAKAGVA
jgi:hypothetical protein